MAKSTRGVRPPRRHPCLQAVPGGFQRLWHRPPVDLTPRARARLAMLDWHRAHGRCVSLTARHFGYSRSTVYRWLARFDGYHLVTLEDRPSAPRRRRRASWTMEQLRAISARRRSWRRPYATRRPRDWTVERPGDLVELDTLDVRPLPGRIWKSSSRPATWSAAGTSSAPTPWSSTR